MDKLKPSDADYKIRAKRIFDSVEQCLDVVNRLDLVKHKNLVFFRRFEVSIGSGDRAWGGCKNGIPKIRISVYCRDHNKEQWLNELQDRVWFKMKVWKEALERAKNNEWMFIEYSHIHKDHDIGSFISDNPLDHVRAVVAHEIAHAIHWWHINECGHKRTRPHGGDWRFLYRALRREWVNPLRSKL